MEQRRREVNHKGISLFSGVGGLDAGLIQRGIKIVGAWDIDEAARETYHRNFGLRPQGVDIAQLRAKMVPKCDIVLAGPPCQGFSSLARRDRGDKRNQLIVSAARLIAETKPKIFLIENVLGLLWYEGGKFIRRLESILSRGGLHSAVIQVDCASLGLAQRRRRVLIVGGRGASGLEVIRRVQVLAKSRASAKHIGDVVLGGGIKNAPNHFPITRLLPTYSKIIRHIQPGQKLCDTRLGPHSVHSWEIPEVFGETTSDQRRVLEHLVRLRRTHRGRRYRRIGDGRAVTVLQLSKFSGLHEVVIRRELKKLKLVGYVAQPRQGYFDIARRFNGRFKRLPLSGVSSAVLADFGRARNVLHPTEPRGLTVRECARLQGFADKFVFVGTTSQQYQLVANAFPPPISRKLADAVIGALHSTHTRSASNSHTNSSQGLARRDGAGFLR